MRELYATIDLGSNSFHMLTAALEHNEIKILESTSEKVMLAEGLSKQEGIHPDAMARGLECIKRYAQRIENIPKENIRIIGTNTLRAAKNATEYKAQLEKILNGIEIEIVSGIEEARLIFLGVNHWWSGLSQFTKNLVIDIGGGSTEFIIGKNFKMKQAESLRMGCVAFQRFFPDLAITPKYFNRAVRAAKYEIRNIQEDFPDKSWQYAVGSAGTFKAIEKILIAQGITEEGITLKGLKQIKHQILTFDNMRELQLEGLKNHRQRTITPGIAIAIAIFDSLKIKKLHISRGGLREGILYDLLGRLKSEDVRQRSITAICKRYHVSEERSKLQVKICSKLARNIQSEKQQLDQEYLKYLLWAAQCCRIGLSINHSQYQSHSAYLIRNSELSGFSIKERKVIAMVVQNQRRKLNFSLFEQLEFSNHHKQQIQQVIFILRLALIIGKNGKPNRSNHVQIAFGKNTIQLNVDQAWLNRHALIRHALFVEKAYWEKQAIDLQILAK